MAQTLINFRIDETTKQLKEGKVVKKTIEELETMENE